jgi:hypothetical protein
VEGVGLLAGRLDQRADQGSQVHFGLLRLRSRYFVIGMNGRTVDSRSDRKPGAASTSQTAKAFNTAAPARRNPFNKGMDLLLGTSRYPRPSCVGCVRPGGAGAQALARGSAPLSARRTLAAPGLHAALRLLVFAFSSTGLRSGYPTLYDSERNEMRGGRGMASIRFAWNPVLVEVRREVCPRAQWQKAGRRWIMSDTEAEMFLRAAQARLDFQRSNAEIRVDDVAWVVGFVRGAPYRVESEVVGLATSTETTTQEHVRTCIG